MANPRLPSVTHYLGTGTTETAAAIYNRLYVVQDLY